MNNTEIKNIVQLDTYAYELIKQDKASIILSIEIIEDSKSEVQAKLKKNAHKVFSILNKFSKLEVSSNGQNINENLVAENDNWVPKGYKGIFTINMTGYDFDEINKAIDSVEEIAVVSNINTSISTKKTKELENKITKEAIESFKTRAQQISEAFNFSTFQISSVQVSRNESEKNNHSFGMSNISASLSNNHASGTTDFYVQPKTERLTVTVKGTIIMINKLL